MTLLNFRPNGLPHKRDALRRGEIIDAQFGVRVWQLTAHVIDREAVNLFAHGYCTLLALALHELYGFHLMLFTTTKSKTVWNGHAFVEISPGRFLDIRGRHEDLAVIEHIYGNDDAHLERVTREEFCARVITPEDPLREPFLHVGTLERTLTFHFARLTAIQALGKSSLRKLASKRRKS